MTQWYSRGDLGEYVLEQVEAMIDENVDMDTFIARLREIGMSDQEIMNVYAEDVLGV
jgi:hypothetical protein